MLRDHLKLHKGPADFVFSRGADDGATATMAACGLLRCGLPRRGKSDNRDLALRFLQASYSIWKHRCRLVKAHERSVGLKGRWLQRLIEGTGAAAVANGDSDDDDVDVDVGSDAE